MPRVRRRSASDELNPWPGYVDALSTLLMVIIFVLLVFVLVILLVLVVIPVEDGVVELRVLQQTHGQRDGDLVRLRHLGRAVGHFGGSDDADGHAALVLADHQRHLSRIKLDAGHLRVGHGVRS